MDPFAAFRDGLVRQADDRELRIARRHLALNLYTARLKSQIGHGLYGRDHQPDTEVKRWLTIFRKPAERRNRQNWRTMTLIPAASDLRSLKHMLAILASALIEGIRILFFVSPFLLSLPQLVRATNEQFSVLSADGAEQNRVID